MISMRLRASRNGQERYLFCYNNTGNPSCDLLTVLLFICLYVVPCASMSTWSSVRVDKRM